MHIDDENKVFSKEILDDINKMLEAMQATVDNSEDESDHAVAGTCALFPQPEQDNVNFGEFELIYEKVLEVED